MLGVGTCWNYQRLVRQKWGGVDHEGAQGTGTLYFLLEYVPGVADLWFNGNQLSNDSSLSSLPLLTTFLKSYSRPYLGITPPQPPKMTSNNDANEHGTKDTECVVPETEDLVEKDIRDRFKRMCEGYFQNVSKKLVVEHNVRAIRSGSTSITHR